LVRLRTEEDYLQDSDQLSGTRVAQSPGKMDKVAELLVRFGI
jgi:hypothetical protein